MADSAGSAPRKRGTRVPENLPQTLRADEAFKAWFRRECPDVDGRTELDQFMDYWTAKTGRDATKLDWTATARKWMRKAQQDITARRPAGPRGQPAADLSQEWMVNRS